MARPKKTQLTARNLQESLWETHLLLKQGKINSKVANSMAKQSAEICRIQKLQIEAAKLTGKLTVDDRNKFLLK